MYFKTGKEQKCQHYSHKKIHICSRVQSDKYIIFNGVFFTCIRRGKYRTTWMKKKSQALSNTIIQKQKKCFEGFQRKIDRIKCPRSAHLWPSSPPSVPSIPSAALFQKRDTMIFLASILWPFIMDTALSASLSEPNLESREEYETGARVRHPQTTS